MSSVVALQPGKKPASLRRLWRDRRGIAVTEFGFIAPLFLLLLMGVFDVGFGMYTQAVLQGATVEGARLASLENTLDTEIVRRVNRQVLNVIPSSDPDTEIDFEFDPVYYQNYAEIELPEDFTDKLRGSPAVKNGVYDPDECFVDRNGNRSWDRDVGIDGRGGAQDVVAIRTTVTYKRIFPFWKMIGQPQNQRLTAMTFLRNQPFSAQAPRVGVRICPV